MAFILSQGAWFDAYGGYRDNTVASVMRVLGVVIWIGGFFLGIYLGSKTSKAMSYLDDSYSKFSFGTALYTWIAAFISGMFPMLYAEILNLIQKGNTISYICDDPIIVNEVVTTNSVIPKTEVSKTEDNTNNYSLDTEGQQLPFDLKELRVTGDGNDGLQVTLCVIWNGVLAIQGILADIEVITIYGETYVVDDVSFVNLCRKGESVLISNETTCKIPDNLINCISHMRVLVKKYVFNNEIYLQGDVISIPSQPTASNLNDFLVAIESMGSAREISKYVDKLSQRGDPIVTDKLLDVIRNVAEYEKFYGNSYTVCMKKIMNLYGLDYYPNSASGTEVNNVGVSDDERNDDVTDEQPVISHESNDGSLALDADDSLNTIENTNPESEVVEYANQIQNPLEPESIYCTNCGKKINNPEANFCTGCGKKIVRY